MDAKREERVRTLAGCNFEILRKARADAAAAGNLSLADDAHAAIKLRARSQTDEIANCGELFEHVEQPNRENGGRFVTRFTGDAMTWFKHFVRPGAICKIREDVLRDLRISEAAAKDAAENGRPVMVRLREGERAAVIDAAGNVISAA